jgi:hypothetical protein
MCRRNTSSWKNESPAQKQEAFFAENARISVMKREKNSPFLCNTDKRSASDW